MTTRTDGSRWITYGLMAIGLLSIAFGGWRLWVSKYGAPEQFLYFDSAGKVGAINQAIARLEADRSGAPDKEKKVADESLRQMKDMRDQLSREQAIREPEGRRTELKIGGIALVAGIGLFVWGRRRLA